MLEINPLFPSAPVVKPPRYKFKPRSNKANVDPDESFKDVAHLEPLYEEFVTRNSVIVSDLKLMIFFVFFFTIISLYT